MVLSRAYFGPNMCIFCVFFFLGGGGTNHLCSGRALQCLFSNCFYCYLNVEKESFVARVGFFSTWSIPSQLQTFIQCFLRRWNNIKTTLDEDFVFAGLLSIQILLSQYAIIYNTI